MPRAAWIFVADLAEKPAIRQCTRPPARVGAGASENLPRSIASTASRNKSPDKSLISSTRAGRMGTPSGRRGAAPPAATRRDPPPRPRPRAAPVVVVGRGAGDGGPLFDL